MPPPRPLSRALLDLLGLELVRGGSSASSPLSPVATSEALAGADLVAVLFSEPSSKKCEDAVARLVALARDVEEYTASSAAAVSADAGGPPSGGGAGSGGGSAGILPEPPRLVTVLVSLDPSRDALALQLCGRDGRYLLGLPHGSPQAAAVARACGLQPAALLLPDLTLLDAATAEPVCTAAYPLLAAGKLAPAAFPERWRTNCFVARCLPTPGGACDDPLAPSSSAATTTTTTTATASFVPASRAQAAFRRLGPSFPTAILADASLLRALLYPGDSVLVRPVGRLLVDRAAAAAAAAVVGGGSAAAAAGGVPAARTTSAAVYVNHNIEEDGDSDASSLWSENDDEDEEEEEEERGGAAARRPRAAKTPAPGELYLPAGVFADLGLVDGATVAIQPYLDMPTAEVVTVAPLPPSSSSSSSAAAAAAAAPRPTRWSDARGELLLRGWFGVSSPEDGLRASALVEAVAAVRGGASQDGVAAVLAQFSPAKGGSSSSPSFGDAAGTPAADPEPAGGRRTNALLEAEAPAPAVEDGEGESAPSPAVPVPVPAGTIADAGTNPDHSYSDAVQEFVADAEVDWIEAVIRRARCRYVPVATGMTIAVPLGGGGGAAAAAATGNGFLDAARAGYPEGSGFAGFVVTETKPRFTAVVVGPETRVVVAR
jgi:hypothetical protein